MNPAAEESVNLDSDAVEAAEHRQPVQQVAVTRPQPVAVEREPRDGYLCASSTAMTSGCRSVRGEAPPRLNLCSLDQAAISLIDHGP